MMKSIAVLGGTGKEGSGLAVRWARYGYDVIIGSRSEEKAIRRVAELLAEIDHQSLQGGLQGLANAEAARLADHAILTVPYSAHRATLSGLTQALNGKILVDVTVPLQPPKVRSVHLPPGQAAALEAQEILGDGVRVVAAFQNVSAEELDDASPEIDCDVLVCSDDREARSFAIELAEAAGMRGIDAGRLRNAIAVESLTPILLHINRHYRIRGSGIRITGID